SYVCTSCSFVFFFQAEDGIRDFHVTGVQTCALPISRDPCVERVARRAVDRQATHRAEPDLLALMAAGLAARAVAGGELVQRRGEIGRASCRESVCQTHDTVLWSRREIYK